MATEPEPPQRKSAWGYVFSPLSYFIIALLIYGYSSNVCERDIERAKADPARGAYSTLCRRDAVLDGLVWPLYLAGRIGVLVTKPLVSP